MVTIKPEASTAVWGVQTQQGDTFASAKIVSQRIRHQCEKEPLKDSSGETKAIAYYDQTKEIEIEVIVESGVSAPEIGSTITVDGQSAYVESVETQWEQRGWKKLSIRATQYVAMS